ncbi:hypothetical protein CLPU_14c00460 [Gottschalkia purinilytica]|uniref:Lipoprotein n=1 Tax=Gottschalkia purinilytica TaxID=1503 RepID=A0A0L0W7S5_GOTPU|nr:hypothetical protein [Gottschalkia purinilytica]KNF07628.1 hypothetical protein CLPU_14c00460 [Gottschalkia purinilytica]
MKRLIITFCIFATLLFTGCRLNYMSSLYSKDNKISSDTNSFSLNKEEQSMDDQEYIGKLEFEGMDTIWKYNAENDMKIKLSYLLSVNKGKAKLVLIDPTGKVETLIENKDSNTQKNIETIMISLKKGKNRIKLVASNKAQIELKLNVNVGDLNKIGFDR